jgi:hypothetical protein
MHEKRNNGISPMASEMMSPVWGLKFRILLKRRFGENDKIR